MALGIRLKPPYSGLLKEARLGDQPKAKANLTQNGRLVLIGMGKPRPRKKP